MSRDFLIVYNIYVPVSLTCQTLCSGKPHALKNLGTFLRGIFSQQKMDMVDVTIEQKQ